MLKHLQELIEADGEATASQVFATGLVLRDCAITHADVIGFEVVNDDGERVMIPWTSVGYLKIELGRQ